MKAQARKQFTLIELLVVIAIIAVIAGGMISSYAGADQKAAATQSLHTNKAVESSVRAYAVANRVAGPDGYDSLLAGTCADAHQFPTASTSELLNSLNSNLKGKLSVKTLSEAQADSLYNGGINSIYYVDKTMHLVTGSATATSYAGDTTAPSVPTNITKNPAPSRVFEVPDNGGIGFHGHPSNANHTSDNQVGRCVVAVLDPATYNSRFKAVYNAGDDALNERLVAFGVSDLSTMVVPNSKLTTPLANAPQDGSCAKTEYARYIAVYNLGTDAAPKSKAQFVGVIDAQGRTFNDLKQVADGL